MSIQEWAEEIKELETVIVIMTYDQPPKSGKLIDTVVNIIERKELVVEVDQEKAYKILEILKDK